MNRGTLIVSVVIQFIGLGLAGKYNNLTNHAKAKVLAISNKLYLRTTNLSNLYIYNAFQDNSEHFEKYRVWNSKFFDWLPFCIKIPKLYRFFSQALSFGVISLKKLQVL